MEKKLTADDCIELLRRRQSELNDAGETRFPKRADFTDREVMAIKAFFGPWGRALEAAGLKSPRPDDRIRRRAEKRELQKQRRNEYRKSMKDNEERGNEK